jgi:hypothetical protein
MTQTSPAEGDPAERHRPLYIIAADIRQHWEKPYFGAIPYIFALRHLNQVTEPYGLDSGVSCVAYFLANAQTWRGPEARRIKQELRDILKGANYVI